MLKFQSRAFVYDNMPNSEKVLGNPAVILLLDKDEKITAEQMSAIGLREKSPMTCFLRRRSEMNVFDISYYNLDGSQAYLCGHATLVASKVLQKLYNLTSIKFYFDTKPFGRPVNNLLEVHISCDQIIYLHRPIQNYEKVVDWFQYTSIFDAIHISHTLVSNVLLATELNDLIFVIDDVGSLRKLKPDFKQLAFWLEKFKFRNFCVTSASMTLPFDFEVRVFAPHDDLNEDIACGSSTLAIANFWGQQTNRQELTVLFPYHLEYDENIAGGVQFIRLDKLSIQLGGFCASVTDGSLYGN